MHQNGDVIKIGSLAYLTVSLYPTGARRERRQERAPPAASSGAGPGGGSRPPRPQSVPGAHAHARSPRLRDLGSLAAPRRTRSSGEAPRRAQPRDRRQHGGVQRRPPARPPSRPLQDGDIINIDVTVYYNGYHGDTSETFLVGNVDECGKKLVEVARRCRDEAIAVCRAGAPFSVIGNTISCITHQNGLQVCPHFVGHGIGSYFHGHPEIWHHANDNDLPMEEGMAFTIEPIITEGSPEFKVLEDAWTVVSLDNQRCMLSALLALKIVPEGKISVMGFRAARTLACVLTSALCFRSAQFEHTVLITSGGAKILTKLPYEA
uniref:Methionine aminopeptidase 1D, mitochondrial isoform X2 n=1 Tax=Castor canadensis TaxID=51338 RepID=A0A8B7WBT3_CASCN|nr:methionine aminopeptidase 1D, mitochondrial isoform X2 [Castor canadensis]